MEYFSDSSECCLSIRVDITYVSHVVCNVTGGLRFLFFGVCHNFDSGTVRFEVLIEGVRIQGYFK